jgi:Rod binding domain-containing protein
MVPALPNTADAAAPSLDEAARKAADPAKIRDAAQQFEALLLGQILRSTRTGGGWLSVGEDPAGDCATEFAEQQLATMMAEHGGLGLAALISRGLQRGR